MKGAMDRLWTVGRCDGLAIGDRAVGSQRNGGGTFSIVLAAPLENKRRDRRLVHSAKHTTQQARRGEKPVRALR